MQVETSPPIEYGRQSAHMEIRFTCAGCPMQFEGSVGDEFFYFRARYETYWCGFGSTLEAAIRDSQKNEGGYIDDTDFKKCFKKLGKLLAKRYGW